MDSLQETKDPLKKSFLNHVFSTTDEGKSELLNVIQYSCFGVVPIVILNKLIQRFVPDADPEKSSLEIIIEIFIQLIFMFCGIVIIHRIITYFPTYSGYKYENLVLTNVILSFLVLILSIQTKMGIKVNIIVDRIYDLWEGTSNDARNNIKKNVRIKENISTHSSSQSDYLDNPSVQTNVFPPAPSTISTQNAPSNGYDNMIRVSGGSGNSKQVEMGFAGPMAANSLLGSSFGAF
jgi:hypothetical protein